MKPDDEVDDRVVVRRGKAALLDREPAGGRETPDLVRVVLDVAAVVLGHAEDELSRGSRIGDERVAPGVRDRRGEARVLSLREDDLASARPEHVRV